MKKYYGLILLLFFMFFITSAFANEAAEIGKMGDNKWDSLIKSYKSQNVYVENKGAIEIVQNFGVYQNKIMMFPKFDFMNEINDDRGNRYYYTDEKGSMSFFVIKYNVKINDKLRLLAAGIGKLDGEWEVIGRIDDAYRWWGNVVAMDIVAMRIPGKACFIVKGNEVTLIGEDIFNKLLADKETNAYEGIPENLKSRPKGLDPLTVAKLFFYTGSVQKNKELWLQFISQESGDNPGFKSKSKSWWRLLSTKNRSYFYVRENPERVRTPGGKCYMFQMKINDKNQGPAKPCFLIKENDDWIVDSAYP